MSAIKIILILAALLLLLLAFRHRQRVGLKAGWRVLSVLLVLAAIVFVIDPDIPQTLAEAVGVTRGTDLILYVLIVVFFFTTLGLYFRSRENEQRLVELARAIAIEVAIERDGEPGRRPVRGEAAHAEPTSTSDGISEAIIAERNPEAIVTDRLPGSVRSAGTHSPPRDDTTG